MKPNYIESFNEEEKFALLFGILAGDGCLSAYTSYNKKYYAIVVTGSSLDDIPFYEQIVIPLINSLREGNKKSVKIKKRLDCNAIEILFTDKILFNKLKSYEFPVGKKGQQLIIPQTFYDKKLVKYIVQGFFATDGSLVLTKNPNKFYPRVEARVIHKDFLKQIYGYLISLGLNGAYYLCKARPDPRWKVVQDQCRFQFNGKNNLLLFNELVGFINPKHKQKFLDFIEYDREYDNAIKGLASKNMYPIRNKINFRFSNQVTLGRF